MPTRVFLDWTAPLLPQLADRLLPAAAQGPLHMGQTLIVVPTKQSGRRLREYLARELRRRGGTALLSLEVKPPTFFMFAEDEGGTAHPFDVLHAWTETLRGIGQSDLPKLLPERSGPMSAAAALDFGRRLQKLREELVDANVDLAAVAARHPEASEQARWREMARLEDAYRRRLADMGLADPCDQKRQRAASFQPPGGVGKIVLACVPDPSPLLLECLARLEGSVTIETWIHAPETEADGFDAWGHPNETWRTRPVGPDGDPPGWIELVRDPAALCDRVAAVLAAGPQSPDVAFGMLDEKLSPRLRHALAGVGRTLYDPRPLPLAEQGPARVLKALHEANRQGDGVSLRALWRHPDLLAALGPDPTKLLAEWDRYARDHVPQGPDSVEETLPDGMLLDAWRTLKTWIAAESAVDRLAVLRDIYRLTRLDPNVPEERFASRAADGISDILQEAARREDAGRGPAPELVLQVLADKSVDPPRVEGDVTAEGWLELSYHPAPSLLLLGMQEGKVPGTRVADAFLPDGLRRALGLRSDRDWLARDAFLFHGLVRSRAPGAVRILCMKRDDAGGPLHPSRLLFQCADAQLLRRARELFDAPAPPPPAPPAGAGLLLRLARAKGRVPERLPVTALKSYLECPTRFYLSQVLQMRHIDDTAREPDAAAFGDLIHLVLEQGFKAVETDPEALAARLDAELDQRVRERYGQGHGLAVKVMAHSAKSRLRAAAKVQVDLWREGWEIRETERSCEREIGGLVLAGKIDRVDWHVEKGWRIVDYKSGDSPKSPKDAHLGPRKPSAPEAVWVEDEKGKPKQWIDLQLPAYRWLAETQDWYREGDKLEVAYFQLPKSVNDCGIVAWADEEGKKEDARKAMAFVVGQIQAGVWGPPNERMRYDDFAPLFHYGEEGLRLPGVEA